MNTQLLAKLFGADGRWAGGCTVILDADANVHALSNDAIVQGGLKQFAPRVITGRVMADTVRLLPDWSALVLVQKTVVRQQTGDDLVKHTVTVVDVGRVAAIEFAELSALALLDVPPPK